MRSSDEAFLRAVLPRVSRTFALSIEALPEALRNPVRVAYLLCRIVDTVEDQRGLGREPRGRLFDLFDQALVGELAAATAFDRLAEEAGLDADGAGGELCQRASVVFQAFAQLERDERAAIHPHVAEMARGMREFAERADSAGQLRLRDIPDLERYCYFVAGTVGLLLTALFERTVPTLDEATRQALRARAVSFGLGLQLVNIVKDVASDHLRGDCFLPESLAQAHGVSLDRVLDVEQRGAGLEVVRALTHLAREHLIRAREYAVLWPRDAGREVRLFCAVPLALALLTLHEVEHGPNTLRSGVEPKVTRAVVARVFSEATTVIQDDTALEAWLRRAAGGDLEAGS